MEVLTLMTEKIGVFFVFFLNFHDSDTVTSVTRRVDSTKSVSGHGTTQLPLLPVPGATQNGSNRGRL